MARADELTPQAVGMLCWGLATLHHHPSCVFLDAMAARLAQRAQHGPQAAPAGDAAGAVLPGGEGTPVLQTLSLVAWAFAQWGHNEPRLLEAIRSSLPALPAAAATAADAAAGEASAGGGGSPPAPAGAAGLLLEGEAEQREVEPLAPPTVSNLAFALAKQGVHDPALLRTLRWAAERSLPG